MALAGVEAKFAGTLNHHIPSTAITLATSRMRTVRAPRRCRVAAPLRVRGRRGGAVVAAQVSVMPPTMLVESLWILTSAENGLRIGYGVGSVIDSRRRCRRLAHAGCGYGFCMSFAVLALVVAVGLLGPLAAARSIWRVPVVLGELAGGILIGSSGFRLVDPASDDFQLLASIGF